MPDASGSCQLSPVRLENCEPNAGTDCDPHALCLDCGFTFQRPVMQQLEHLFTILAAVGEFDMEFHQMLISLESGIGKKMNPVIQTHHDEMQVVEIRFDDAWGRSRYVPTRRDSSVSLERCLATVDRMIGKCRLHGCERIGRTRGLIRVEDSFCSWTQVVGTLHGWSVQTFFGNYRHQFSSRRGLR